MKRFSRTARKVQLAGYLLRRSIGLTIRSATSRWRALPSVFILGAPKCGTTSLAEYLCRHSHYVPALSKELMFLQDLPNFRTNFQWNFWLERAWGRYEQGARSYRKFFPLNMRMKMVTHRTGRPAVTGDHTPFYLYCHRAAQRIREISPEAKLIVLLRDPVARTYSDYSMHRTWDPEETRSFEEAIQDELSGACTDFRRTYLHMGIYGPHLQRWMSLFPREQFLILRSEDLIQNPGTVVKEVHTFLGCSPGDHQDLPARNRGRYREPMKSETRAWLEEYFRPFNRKLYDLLSRDLGWGDPVLGSEDEELSRLDAKRRAR